MHTTRNFLKDLKQRHGLKTDGDLHRLLGVSRERISKYQQGHDHFGDEMCIQVAELLDLNPAYVLACVAAERTKSESARKAWRHVAAATAAALIAAVSVQIAQGGFSEMPEISVISSAEASNQFIHYTQSLIFAVLACAALIRRVLAHPDTPKPPPTGQNRSYRV
jgi:transcriptional regulator with XRE-family HTH domain